MESAVKDLVLEDYITKDTNSLVETARDYFTEFDVQETTELLAHSAPILI